MIGLNGPQWTVSRRGVLTAAVAAATLPMAGPAAAGSATALAAQQVAVSGAWCWFGDPRAVHVGGERPRTFVGYITAHGDIAVAQFDHHTAGWTTAVVAAGFQIDDHNNPSIVIRPDRRVVVFWSAHAGGVMYYRRSAHAEDVAAWEAVKTVPVNTPGSAGYTYPNPVQLGAEPGRLYLFWRGGNMNPTFATTSGGDRWSAAQNLVLVPGQRPYLKVASDGVDTLHFAFTDGHPRNVHTSVFHMFYRDGGLYRSDGSRIGPMGTPVTPDQATRVYDARGNTDGKAWIHDIAVGGDGHPVLTYATFPTDADHRYRYARFTGTAWFDRQLTSAGGTISEDTGEPNYSGGITIDSDDPTTVLLSRPVRGVHEIERWTTSDGGRCWRTEAVTADSTLPNVRPFSPRGLRSDGPLGIVWMAGRYPSYKRYQTGILATA